jgi:hypothetical protein
VRHVGKRLAFFASLFAATGIIGAVVLVQLPRVKAAGATMDPFHTAFVLGKVLSVQAKGHRNRVSLAFQMPPTSLDRRRLWWVINAEVRVSLVINRQTRSPAEVDIGANQVDGIAATLTGDLIHSQALLSWGMSTLLSGDVGGVTSGKTVTLHLRDYLPAKTMHSGRNTIFLELWNFGVMRVKRAALLPGTRVEYGVLGPAHLRMRAVSHQRRIKVGDAMAVSYQIDNSGWPAKDVGLIVASSGPGLQVIGSPTRYWNWLQSAHGIFYLRALRPGLYRAGVALTGSTGVTRGVPADSFEIRVVSTQDG